MTTEKPSRFGFVPCHAAFTMLLAIVIASLTATAVTASPAGLRVLSTSVAGTSRSWTYEWPVKPFDRQHPVRAFLNDPRIGEHGSTAFHFGIDIAVPDGTAVYAVAAGTVYLSPCSVAVVSNEVTFGYWHIVPAVRHHQYVEQHALLGWVGKGWGHVHFAERRGGVYVNPLRPGGLGPYSDGTAPTVGRVTFAGGALVAVAFDTPSPRVPGAWAGEPVTPALLRWRIAGTGTWRVAADFRSAMLPASRFAEIYASGTRQNHKGIPGCFRFILVRGAEARALARSGCAIEVEATDTAGNRVVAEWVQR